MKKIHSFIQITIKFLFKNFSQLTPFDLYLILFFFLGIMGVWRVWGSKSVWHEIRVEIMPQAWENNAEAIYGTRVPFWLHENLYVGMTEKDSLGRKTAEIKKIDSYERGREETVTYLVVSVKTKYDTSGGIHSYKGTSLAVGRSLDFIFGSTYVPTQIINADYLVDESSKKEFVLSLRGRGQESFLVKSVKKSHQSKNLASGEVIFEVLDIKTLPSSVNRARIYEDQLLFQSNADLVDIVVKAKVIAENVNNRWYFAGHQQLKLGEQLWIYFSDYNLQLEVEEISPLDET